MEIQYLGFTVATTSRMYNFQVLDSPGKRREFVVEVQLRTFRSTSLGLQDGPEICLARLKRELKAETQETPAEPHLRLSPQDIQEYLQRRHPRKRS